MSFPKIFAPTPLSIPNHFLKKRIQTQSLLKSFLKRTKGLPWLSCVIYIYDTWQSGQSFCPFQKGLQQGLCLDSLLEEMVWYWKGGRCKNFRKGQKDLKRTKKGLKRTKKGLKKDQKGLEKDWNKDYFRILFLRKGFSIRRGVWGFMTKYESQKCQK